ncbi:VanZ family protein [Terribacillus saccharophilus]|uniref:VanZ-like domain-containing protein n=1 Tax=Terribacillus saccharophilus TaxID=361277 RepID=A0ABX4GVH0_9BACI|nr:VanZ family protein [Terribacillus saccharophilus]PAD34536.1 hypothetical protein CHH56_14470 [Terribacillus saccharophilus]PAD95203.1 hypothetical protein CHH50_14705 [Terribacillus saccharophilus]PAD98864.1 hypothetical protein CHH48_15595 [Terribacillus saccharophilus]
MLTYVAPAIFLAFVYLLSIIPFHQTVGITKKQHLLMASFAIYVIAVICLTFFPLPVDQNLIEENQQLETSYRWNTSPLTSIMQIWHTTQIDGFGYGLALKNLGGNILLFVPLGFYLPLLIRRTRSFFIVVLCGFVFSTAVESTQGLLNYFVGYNYRSVDIDDVILNVLGAMLGYAFYWIALRPLLKRGKL